MRSDAIGIARTAHSAVEKMDFAVHDCRMPNSVKRLPQWVTLSIVVHALTLLTFGIGPGVTGPYRLPDLTVDIRSAANSEPVALAIPDDTLPVQRKSVALPRRPISEAAPDKPSATSPPSRVPLDPYLNMNDVDIRAEPINDPPLRYPWVEYQQRLAGVVRVALFINAQGVLERVDVMEATPPGHFEEAALEAVVQLRFRPAIKNGRPVKSQKTIDVVFDPDESLDRVSATQPDPSAAGR